MAFRALPSFGANFNRAMDFWLFSIPLVISAMFLLKTSYRLIFGEKL